jgi:hypothetical protein
MAQRHQRVARIPLRNEQSLLMYSLSFIKLHTRIYITELMPGPVLSNGDLKSCKKLHETQNIDAGSQVMT